MKYLWVRCSRQRRVNRLEASNDLAKLISAERALVLTVYDVWQIALIVRVSGVAFLWQSLQSFFVFHSDFLLVNSDVVPFAQVVKLDSLILRCSYLFAR